MKVVLRESKASAGAAVVPLLSEASVARDSALDKSSRDVVSRALSAKVFRGDRGEVSVQASPDAKSGPCILLGLGKEASLDGDKLRRIFGVLARRLAHLGVARVKLPLKSSSAAKVLKKLGWEEGARAMVEGVVLGSYRFDLKSEGSKRKPANVTLTLDPAGATVAQKTAARRGAKVGNAVGAGVLLARELGNAPANQLYPETLAARARKLGRSSGLKVKVLSKSDLEKEKMGAILAVSQGSARQPRMIVVEHRPPRTAGKSPLVLVGKAVTFDSGGISIKPARGMEDMKFDMGGGAAVLGAMQVIAELGLPIPVVAIVPAAENLLGSAAYRPGDVITSGSGKTIEVINTDAEGRLLLADGIHYSRRYKPGAVVDVATLTGACVVALGSVSSGLMSNNDKLAAKILKASESSGERVWRLPIYEEYSEMVKSPIADVRNSSGRDAGACTAAAFLGHFAKGLTWAHLDIAGTGWTARDRGYQSRGATGAGVRVLVELARSFAGK